MKLNIRHLSLLLVLGLAAPTKPLLAAPKSGATVFQYSTLPALGLGIFDGELTVKELLKQGNFGLGTLQALDGEVIIKGGVAYQVRSDGQIFKVPGSAKTPFAVVSNFKADISIPVTASATYAEIKKKIDAALPSPNVPYAIEVSGQFTSTTTRSVKAQSLPYPTLADAVKTQSIFKIPTLSGSMVGFRFPSYLSQVNLADYHFHFLTDNMKYGGHLLDCSLAKGEIKIQILRGVDLRLPHNEAFEHADLSGDQQAALDKAEKAPEGAKN